MKNSKAAILQRQNKLLEYLHSYPEAKIGTMAQELKVSAATIRRDLQFLQSNHEIKRVFTGRHYSRLPLLPTPDSERYHLCGIKEKQAIARRAAQMLENDDTIFINSSSTALEIYPFIRDINVNIITNNGRSMLQSYGPNISLFLTGGEVQGNRSVNTRYYLGGIHALNTIHQIVASKCILGVSGISASFGLSSMTPEDPALNQAMIAHCNGPVIVVADHRKVGVAHNFRFGQLRDISIFITDAASDPAELDKIRAAGVEVIVVEADAD